MFSSMLLRARGSLEGSRTGWWVAGIPVGCLDWPLEPDRNAFYIGQIINKMKGSRLGVQAGVGFWKTLDSVLGELRPGKFLNRQGHPPLN